MERALRKRSSRAGFTLMELIGVLAIMAILATVLTPNVIKSLDRAAVQAETQTLDNLGEQVKLYLKQNKTLPATATWYTQLATYADLNPNDVWTNRRQMQRVYLQDPSTSPAERVIILSSMRQGLALPASLNAADFNTAWTTTDWDVPTTLGWAGWDVEKSREYFVIERINLRPILLSELRTVTITLINSQSATGTGGTGTGGTGTGGSGSTGSGSTGNGNNGNGNGAGGNGNGNNGNGNGNGGSGSTGGSGSGSGSSTTPVAASFVLAPLNGSGGASGTVGTASTRVITARPGQQLDLYLGSSSTPSYTFFVPATASYFNFETNGSRWFSVQ